MSKRFLFVFTAFLASYGAGQAWAGGNTPAALYRESPPAPATDWSGYYKTDFGKAVIIADGSRIRGIYSYTAPVDDDPKEEQWYFGWFSGTLEGNGAHVDWLELGGSSKPESRGKAFLVLKAPGTFVGSWGKNESDDDAGSWNGKREDPIAAEPESSEPQWQGEWDTNFGPVTFDQVQGGYVSTYRTKGSSYGLSGGGTTQIVKTGAKGATMQALAYGRKLFFKTSYSSGSSDMGYLSMEPAGRSFTGKCGTKSPGDRITVRWTGSR
jgi:hypothetical protein